MNKSELRNHLRQLRQSLSETERETFSRQICHNLEKIDWSGIHLLHCFKPIAKLHEVDATAFMAVAQEQYPNMQLYTSQLIDGNWKIVSWQNHSIDAPPQLDAVIVPMLGFDSDLQRIGYGGGYYDRLLATEAQAKKIGVCFELGKVQHIPSESHDIPLDSIVTEANVYRNT
jgi:5-formyltetrahydrofolate cyclo-ligase